MKKTYKKIFLWGIVPVFLLLFWVLSTLLFTTDYSLSVLSSNYSSRNISNFNTDELLKNEKIVGEFRAKENNLGIVAVRFFNFNRISDDFVIFRLFDKGSNKLLYENKYKVDQFQPNQFFTFGFPIINDSENKNYKFEIISIDGREGNAIALSQLEPSFAAQYQYTKTDLLNNKLYIPTFFAKKIYYSFSDLNVVVSSLIFLLPLVLYLIFLIRRESILKRKSYLPIYILLISVSIFIFFIEDVNRLSEVILIFLWIILAIFYKLESTVSFLIALVFLSTAPIFIIFNQEIRAENAAIWTYFFLVIGAFQMGYELWRKPKNLVSYDKFIKKILGIKKYDRIRGHIGKYLN